MEQARPPLEPALIDGLAALVDLTIPPECRPGVTANLELLRRHADLLFGFPLPEDREPAFEYRP